MIDERWICRVLHRNRSIRQWSWWTLRRDALRHGRDVRGWHATNMGLHVICSVLVYAILRAFFSLQAAALGAAVFATHPLATSAVASISGRFGLLCAAFYFATLLSVIIGGFWLAAVPVLVYGAWNSKEEAITLPLAIIATLFVMRLS